MKRIILSLIISLALVVFFMPFSSSLHAFDEPPFQDPSFPPADNGNEIEGNQHILEGACDTSNGGCSLLDCYKIKRDKGPAPEISISPYLIPYHQGFYAGHSQLFKCVNEYHLGYHFMMNPTPCLNDNHRDLLNVGVWNQIVNHRRHPVCCNIGVKSGLDAAQHLGLNQHITVHDRDYYKKPECSQEVGEPCEVKWGSFNFTGATNQEEWVSIHGSWVQTWSGYVDFDTPGEYLLEVEFSEILYAEEDREHCSGDLKFLAIDGESLTSMKFNIEIYDFQPEHEEPQVKSEWGKELYISDEDTNCGDGSNGTYTVILGRYNHITYWERVRDGVISSCGDSVNMGENDTTSLEANVSLTYTGSVTVGPPILSATVSNSIGFGGSYTTSSSQSVEIGCPGVSCSHTLQAVYQRFERFAINYYMFEEYCSTNEITIDSDLTLHTLDHTVAGRAQNFCFRSTNSSELHSSAPESVKPVPNWIPIPPMSPY